MPGDERPCTCRTTGEDTFALRIRICDRCAWISPRDRRAIDARDALLLQAAEAYTRIRGEPGDA